MVAKWMRRLRSLPSQNEDLAVRRDVTMTMRLLVGIRHGLCGFLAHAGALGRGRGCSARRPCKWPWRMSSSWTMSWTSSMWTKALIAAADAVGDARGRSSMAGSGSSLVVRKALRQAISILLSVQGTTVPLRRIRRTVMGAADGAIARDSSRVPESL